MRICKEDFKEYVDACVKNNAEHTHMHTMALIAQKQYEITELCMDKIENGDVVHLRYGPPVEK